MGWKCVPQIKGLVRGEPEPGNKRRAPGIKICMEAGNERASKSKTLDRKRSHLNEYSVYSSGAECWAAMEADAAAYRSEYTDKHGKQRSRKLRADAVIGWAMIFKPPADVSQGWTPEQKAKFVEDSWTVMRLIEPRLFRTSNVRMVATHRDEDGDHAHLIGDSKDEAGAYCGNLIDLNLMDRINAQYPELMRQIGGWDIEDAEVTDWEKYRNDPEYRAAVDARKAAGPGGLPVNEYGPRAAAQRAEEAARMYGDAVEALREAEEAREAARGMQAQAKAVEAVSEAVTAPTGVSRRPARRLPCE